jgi:hypothetical protein
MPLLSFPQGKESSKESLPAIMPLKRRKTAKREMP